ncbi:CpsD/CapB family tyrosine-protein kinase [Jeotgalibaca sp. A127]|uniref:CpsD/CapB family tyrosine-protein kinase n=1 Tax=Jeotgalibaca sp. A127 TaxID=3457324 RepID=UPI003FD4B5E1
MLFGRKKRSKKDYKGLITLASPGSLISEQFRTLRTNIEFAMVDKKYKSLVVTSSMPDAGKSTVAANLAITFARQGYKVLLAEADFRRPSVHKAFQVLNGAGMTSLLSNPELTIEECVLETDINNLSLMTCGPIPPNPAELIGSNRMRELQDKLVSKYDLVIFDTPPLLGFGDAQIMAGRAEGTIFVVRHGVAKKENMLKANEILTRVGANVLGAVYNQVPTSEQDNSYYYYYTEEN